MKLVLKHEWQKGGWNKIGGFRLKAQAVITSEERENINKYQLADTVLYENEKTKVKLGSLVEGTQLFCEDIVEMLMMEQAVKGACGQFKAILEAAANFEGEEVIEYT